MKTVLFWLIMVTAFLILFGPAMIDKRYRKRLAAENIRPDPQELEAAQEQERTELKLSDKIKLEQAKKDLSFQLHKKRNIEDLKRQAENELEKTIVGGKEYCKYLKKVVSYETQLNAIEQRILKADIIIKEYE